MNSDELSVSIHIIVPLQSLLLAIVCAHVIQDSGFDRVEMK